MVRRKNTVWTLSIAIVLSIFLYNINLSFAQPAFEGLQQSTNPFKYDGFRITSIEVIGNNILTKDQVIKDFGVSTGSTFNSRTINNAIIEMFSNSKYERAAIDIEQTSENTITLKIIISEQPIISSIYFNGNKKISSGSLKSEIEPYLTVGGTYSAQNLNDAANSIISNYQSKGYLKVYVSPKVKEDKDNSSVEIDFDIEEGQEIQVESINFFGNTKYNSNTLRDQMSTKIRGAFSFGKFDEAAFQYDLDSVVVYYRDRGYYYAEVTDVRYRYEWKDPNVKDVQNLIIDVYIKEGDQYDFGRIDIRGNIVISTETLYRNVSARRGGAYSYTTFYTDYTRLQSLYSERGYIFRQVIPIVDVDEEHKLINISYDIIENDKAHIEGIKITGNTKTKDYVIERYIDIKPGETFNATKIQRIQQQLFNTQFFENINVGVEPGTVEGLMDLTLDIEEGKTAMVSGGFGYSTSSGFSGFAELQENNFLGRAYQIGISGEYGEDLKRIGLNFANPYLFNKPVYFGASVSYFYQDVNTGVDIGTSDSGSTIYSEYSRQGVNFLVRFGTYFWRYFTLFTTLDTIVQQYRQNEAQGASADGSAYVPNDVGRELDIFKEDKNGNFQRWESDWNWTMVPTVSLVFDRRNNSSNPTKGVYARLDADAFFLFTEASRLTAKVFAAWRTPFAYFDALPYFLRDSSFAFYFEFGQILQNPFTQSIKNDDNILYSLNPFEDIRGWSNDSYTLFKLNRGLSLYTFTDGDIAAYGRSEVRAFLEYRVPIVKDIVGLVAFFDMGQIWLPYASVESEGGENTYTYGNEIMNFSALTDVSQYIYSVGFGVRLTIPIFNIRLYWAKRMVHNKGTVGFQDFEYDDYGVLGESFGRGWEIVFSMNHQFY